MSDPQRWAEERLVSYLLDALPEADARKVEELLGEREEYQEILTGRTPDEIGHLPASLLARWHQAGLQLVGVERVLVLQHLKGCAECRQELALVGGSLESWVEAPESAPREPMGHRPSDGGRHRRERAPIAWFGWLGGAAMGVAAGILIMLFLPGNKDPRTGLHGVPLPVVVPQTLRGAERSTVELATADSPLLLALALPRFENPVDAQLVVLDPNGLSISRTQLALGPSAKRTVQLVLQPPDGWLEGEYAIQLMTPQKLEAQDLGSFAVHVTP